MSSVIKVDQIQLADGSTPTAADLGLNTSGSVIQVQSYAVGSDILTTSTSRIDSGMEVSITPRFSSSNFLVRVTCPNAIASGSASISAAVYRQIGSSGYSILFGLAGDAGYDESSTGLYFGALSAEYLDTTNGNTDVRTYKVQFNNGQSSGYAYLNSYSGSGTYCKAVMTVMEIAG